MVNGGQRSRWARGCFPARQSPGLDNCEPSHHCRDQAGDPIGQERRSQPVVFGQKTARKRTDSDREDERRLVDGDCAPASLRGADVGQHDLACRYDQACARAGDEPRQDEFRVGGGPGAPQVADGRDQSPDRQCRSASEAIGHLARGQCDDEPRQTVYGDGKADGGGRHTKRLRVERQRRHHAAETELVDSHEHAHPDEHTAFERHAGHSQVALGVASAPCDGARCGRDKFLISHAGPLSARRLESSTRRPSGCEGKNDAHNPRCRIDAGRQL